MTTYIAKNQEEKIAIMLRMNTDDKLAVEYSGKLDSNLYTYKRLWSEQVQSWRYNNECQHSVLVPKWFTQYKLDKSELLATVLEYELDSIARNNNILISDLRNNNVRWGRDTIWVLEKE